MVLPAHTSRMAVLCSVVMAVLVLTVAQASAAQKKKSAGADGNDIEETRTALYASDYHEEAMRAIRTVLGAGERVRKLNDQAKTSDLIVLVNSLEKNLRSIEGLEEIANQLYMQLGDRVPRVDREATDTERASGDDFLRRINVVKDRAVALYRSSASFARKLTRKSDTTITRLDERP